MNYNSTMGDHSSDMVVEYSETKDKLLRMNEEVEKLKAENERLAEELAEKNTAVQNLFSFIHGAGA